MTNNQETTFLSYTTLCHELHRHLDGRVSVRWIHDDYIIASDTTLTMQKSIYRHVIDMGLLFKVGMAQVFSNDGTDMRISLNKISTISTTRQTLNTE